MALLVLAFFVSLLPAVFIYYRLKKLKLSDMDYPVLCRKALLGGICCALPVVLTSMVLNIIESFIPFPDVILKTAFHTFIVLALAEEANKYLALRRLLKKYPGSYSRLAVTAFMTIVGIGFEVLEAVPYALGTNEIQMLVRGATLMHGIYGFILGLAVSEAFASGRKAYEAGGFLTVWFLHGLYDFTLQEEVLEVSDLVVFVPVTLAFVSLVLVFVLLIFVHKAEKNEYWTAPEIAFPGTE